MSTSAAAFFLLPINAWAGEYHVAENGLDSHPGSLEQPFKTITKAASAARPGDTVLIRAGTYRETIIPKHSGEPGKPITFRNYPNEIVTVSGADLIDPNAWKTDGTGAYQATAPMPLGTDNQLFLDSRMMIEARFPNTSLDVSRPVKLTAESGSFTGKGNTAEGTIRHNSLNQPAGHWVGAKLHISLGKVWIAETVKVTASGPGWVRFIFNESTDYQPTAGNTFFLTSGAAALDAPGEWFFDPVGITLSFRTPDGTKPSLNKVEYKARQYAFDLRGKSHIVVQGLTLFANTIVTDPQSHHLTLDSLNARYLSHFTVLQRWLTGLADSGIILDGQSNTLSNSILAFSAGNGVSLLGSGNKVVNNVIHDVDYSGGVGAGINTGGGCRGALIERNSIYDVGHRMIDIGKLSAGRVQYNDLWAGGIQVTDFGGIYAASTDGGGTVICYNKIHDTNASEGASTRDNNAKGIYLDNGSFNYVVHHNLVWNVDKAFVVNTRENKPKEISRNLVIVNNTLIGNKYSYGWKHCRTPDALIANNIFSGAKATIGVGAKASNNLFPDTDPRFVPGLSFALRADSPARKAGLANALAHVARQDVAPDLGAFAYGVPPWTAGSSLAKEQKSPAAKTSSKASPAANIVSGR
ncbi:MAG: right-handed parallel beta-helix repeat-containing protein [Akkermansiaceae bacterium]